MIDGVNASVQSYFAELNAHDLSQYRLIGIGCDLCEVQRMTALVSRWGDKIAARILSPEEKKTWVSTGRKDGFLAKRWAGKEAVVKAIGIGFAKGLRWRDVSILNDENGKPYVEFGGQTQQILSSHNLQFTISLADEKEYALGFVVALQSQESGANVIL